jgi:hypothetical protein
MRTDPVAAERTLNHHTIWGHFMIQTFLLIGQSNMAGRGPLDEVPPIVNSDVQMFRDGLWMPASEPLHTDKPAMAGIGRG